MAKGSQSDSVVLPSLPETTARAARVTFSADNLYLAVGDELETILDGIPLSDLDPGGTFRPGTLALLAVVTVFEFAEDLTDRQACTSLLSRMDWKYALHLPIEYPQLDPVLFCTFRRQLLDHPTNQQPFERLIGRFGTIGLLERGKRETQAHALLEYLCRLNQLERVLEAASQAIEALACYEPDLLRSVARPHWYARYRQDERGISRRPGQPVADLNALGSDIYHLLVVIAQITDSSVRQLPELRLLADVWEQHFELQGTTVIWRDASCRLCPAGWRNRLRTPKSQ